MNVNLGAPIHLETFDGVAEGALPAGWSVANFTDLDTVPGHDLNNFHSDSFRGLDRDQPQHDIQLVHRHARGADFLSVINVAPNQVINNALVTNLISDQLHHRRLDRSNNQKQIQYLFTGDYNLSGKNNVYLAFNNIWIQNQDSMAAVEYSINGGATWLPALYMLDGPDILRDNAGNIDASNTFATVYTDVPRRRHLTGGNYGLFIGVAQNQWASLAPYLSRTRWMMIRPVRSVSRSSVWLKRTTSPPCASALRTSAPIPGTGASTTSASTASRRRQPAIAGQRPDAGHADGRRG